MSNTIEQLEQQIEAARDAYYNTDSPLMSDADYDALERLLKEHDPTNKLLIGVGSEVRGERVKLPIQMGSLDQVDEAVLNRWLSGVSGDIVLTDKLDGVSCLIVYNRSGELQIAYSRGDGFEGHDVTRHIRNIKSVPKKINGKRLVISEVIVPKYAFEQAKTGKKNPRNYVAGQMNSSNASNTFYDIAHVVTYGDQHSEKSKSVQLEELKNDGFLVAGWRSISKNADFDFEEYTKKCIAESIYELDGIVVDVDNNNERAKLQAAKKSSNLNPAYSKKFKVVQENNSAVSEVVNVHWQPSKGGLLKPRVEITPVDLMGVTVTYATGHNAKFITDKNIGVGSIIKIRRSGDVIPYIEEVITASTAPACPDSSEFGPYKWNDNNVEYELLDKDIPQVRFRQMVSAFSRFGMEYISERGLEQLFDAGYETTADVILASEETLKTVVGNSAGTKGFKSLHTALANTTYSKLSILSSVFANGVGESRIAKIESVYPDVLSVTREQILELDGFADKTADAILKDMPKFKNFLNKINGLYTIVEETPATVTGNAFENEVVVFTGIRDKDMEAWIVENGGTIASGVSKKTTMLVTKDPSSTSSKITKAKEQGVRVVAHSDLKQEQNNA